MAKYIDYEDFEKTIKDGIASGEIQSDVELDEFGIAVSWAVGRCYLEGIKVIDPYIVWEHLPERFKEYEDE